MNELQTSLDRMFYNIIDRTPSGNLFDSGPLNPRWTFFKCGSCGLTGELVYRESHQEQCKGAPEKPELHDGTVIEGTARIID